MVLSNPFPGHTTLTTFADLRRDLEGLVARNSAGVMRAGVFPDHLNPIVTGRSDMKVNIGDFRAVQNRGGAVLLANVGTDTSVTLPAAPGANKRIDLIYVTMRSAALGDAASTPLFGFVQGTASATPVAPSLPANLSTAIPLATVEIPAGATTTLSAGVVISQVYPYTALAGGVVPVRNTVELGAWTPADGSRALCIADGSEYVRRGGVWVGASTVANLVSAALASNSWTVLSSPASWTIDAAMRDSPWSNGIVIPAAGLYRVEGSLRVMAGLPVVYAAKLNNTVASNAGLFVAATTPGVASEALISFSRTMRFAANDVITPAAYTSGTAGPYGITASGTGFSVTRV